MLCHGTIGCPLFRSDTMRKCYKLLLIISFIAKILTAAEAEHWAGDANSIQKALDAAAPVGGNVNLSTGRYRLDKPINIPNGVGLIGTWPGPHCAELTKGTVFMVTAGKNQE